MSLVATASVWINDDQNKKRVPTLRKTVKLRPSHNNDDNNTPNSVNEYYSNMRPNTIEDVQSASQDRNTRVADMLNKITSVDASDESSNLGNFKPISPPTVNVKRDDESIDLQTYTPPIPRFKNNGTASNIYGDKGYGMNDTTAAMYSNYNKSYEPPKPIGKQPYYSTMGISGNGGGDNKLLEKINYMIHLLEQQQHEKTDNIT